MTMMAEQERGAFLFLLGYYMYDVLFTAKIQQFWAKIVVKERRYEKQGIRLRRGEADGPNPRIPAVGADMFGSFIRRRVAEIRRRKSVGSTRRACIVEVDSRP
ncbi:hypothetical protein THAOC_31618 [Thalassiosira oceanica]|uniref:Uncharacterized protein n=1 Tax=Thalassiosira oceanica TaxID=159749 RepID=K0R8U4_THAOC|nr:hypothetical protein THAOC_31618 [Thalassiosira oceanica]|eukprot:EJK49500.1 hypothetical protein THAOC_31618 [Thalassiosira oceanica]